MQSIHAILLSYAFPTCHLEADSQGGGVEILGGLPEKFCVMQFALNSGFNGAAPGKPGPGRTSITVVAHSDRRSPLGRPVHFSDMRPFALETKARSPFFLPVGSPSANTVP